MEKPGPGGAGRREGAGTTAGVAWSLSNPTLARSQEFGFVGTEQGRSMSSLLAVAKCLTSFDLIVEDRDFQPQERGQKEKGSTVGCAASWHQALR